MNWLCWFKHKWLPWRQCNIQVAYVCNGERLDTVLVSGQKRTCSRCGKTQVEEL